MSDSPFGSEVTSASDEPSDELDQLQPSDSLVDRGVDDVLDEGYAPPEQWSPGEGFGTTVEEALEGESLDQRIAQEVPDPDPYADPPPGGIDLDPQIGTERSGRLVAPDAGTGEDAEATLIGADAGVDGGVASAEEAAVRVIDDLELDDDLIDDDDDELEQL